MARNLWKLLEGVVESAPVRDKHGKLIGFEDQIGNHAAPKVPTAAAALPKDAVKRAERSTTSGLKPKGLTQKSAWDDVRYADDYQEWDPETGRVRGPQMGVQPAGQIGPKHKGSFIGQTWKRSGQEKSKPMTYLDKPTGDKKRGKVTSKPDGTGQEAVWDGQKWVTPATWAQQNMSGQRSTPADSSSEWDLDDDDDQKSATP